jgi:tetratricopeptide (TPR) repeat protein
MIWLKFDAETVNNMAQYFYRRNKPLAALQYLEKALWQDTRLKQRDFVAKTCLHFSNVLAKLNRHEEALKLSEQSLILFQAEQQHQKQQKEENADEFSLVGELPEKKAKHGARNGQQGGEDDVVDTIEAAIAIAFHNIGVQQMSCGLLEEGIKSTSQALAVGKNRREPPCHSASPHSFYIANPYE